MSEAVEIVRGSDAMIDATTEKLRIWNENAIRCGKMAVMYALAIGAELIQKKKELPHGAFMKVYSDAGLKPNSASRYMKLALAFEARNSNFALCEICETDGTVNISPDVMEKVVKIVDGKSLTQLYWDWGIKKSDGKTGGFKGGKKLTLPERQRAAAKMARDAWTRIRTSLHSEMRSESWRLLAMPEREVVIEGLDLAIKVLRKNTK